MNLKTIICRRVFERFAIRNLTDFRRTPIHRVVEMIRSECGPVVGTHAGPGTLGVAYYAG